MIGVAALVSACAAIDGKPVNNHIVNEGLIDCFASGLTDNKGELVYCEASGIAVVDSTVIIASDKQIPGGSPIFTVQLSGDEVDDSKVDYIGSEVLTGALKYEDLTITTDKRFVIATTAFDRHRTDKAKWDPYNSLIYWPVDNPQRAQIVMPSQREGYKSSLSLRERLVQTLGVDYFKVEGLAALPDQKLLIGIRELGQSYKEFEYKVLVLMADYHINERGELYLGVDLQILHDFSIPKDYQLPDGLGLSSIEYMQSSDEVLITTSWEKNGQLGGALWFISREQLLNGGSLRPVLNQHNEILRFNNKIEGISDIGRSRVMAIHDDDRVTDGHLNRKPNQAVYSIIELAD